MIRSDTGRITFFITYRSLTLLPCSELSYVELSHFIGVVICSFKFSVFSQCSRLWGPASIFFVIGDNPADTIARQSSISLSRCRNFLFSILAVNSPVWSILLFHLISDSIGFTSRYVDNASLVLFICLPNYQVDHSR